MTITERFFDHLHNNLQAVLDNEQENIYQAARLVVESFKNGGDEMNKNLYDTYYGYWK